MNARSLSLLGLGLAVMASCVNVDKRLGQDYLATNQQYKIYTAEFPIEDIEMAYPEELSSLDNYRFTIGAVRDETFGLSTRATTFTLVPLVDTLDFGKPGTRKVKRFQFSAPLDTTSYTDPSQKHILQNINVYEVEEYVDLTQNAPQVKHGSRRITKGIPIFNGKDSLRFEFSEEFALKYMEIEQADLDSITTYSKKFPGIYMDTDAPYGDGGRINVFKLPLDVYKGYIYGSYASLNIEAEYEGKGVVDTTFYFTLGPVSMYDYSSLEQTTVTSQPQVAYNLSTSESASMAGKAGEICYFEGGKGLKPVIKAAALREKILNEVSAHGDPSEIIVSKASITLPFEFPEDYEDMIFYPTTLSPTCRVVNDKEEVSFANLTDASISSENQGDIDRSNLCYAPDITHHAQELITLKDESKVDNYDIWFLAVAVEDVTSTGTTISNSEYNDYMQSLAYASYYNSMYNGGYGYGGYGYGYGYGYGGYGGYGNSNYYSYMMMMQLMNSSSGNSSATELSLLDLGRFYKARLHGPGSSSKVPTFSITYAVPVSK